MQNGLAHALLVQLEEHTGVRQIQTTDKALHVENAVPLPLSPQFIVAAPTPLTRVGDFAGANRVPVCAARAMEQMGSV